MLISFIIFLRWTEESRVLDGDSLHDCMTACKPDILTVVEKHRDAELNERREKKKKAAEEEEEKRKKEEEEKKKREPEASTTPAPESAGQSAGSGDEMDVVRDHSLAMLITYSTQDNVVACRLCLKMLQQARLSPQ